MAGMQRALKNEREARAGKQAVPTDDAQFHTIWLGGRPGLLVCIALMGLTGMWVYLGCSMNL